MDNEKISVLVVEQEKNLTQKKSRPGFPLCSMR